MNAAEIGAVNQRRVVRDEKSKEEQGRARKRGEGRAGNKSKSCYSHFLSNQPRMIWTINSPKILLVLIEEKAVQRGRMTPAEVRAMNQARM